MSDLVSRLRKASTGSIVTPLQPQRNVFDDAADRIEALEAELAEAQRGRCPNLMPVITWLENGCDAKEAAKELRIYQAEHYDKARGA